MKFSRILASITSIIFVAALCFAFAAVAEASLKSIDSTAFDGNEYEQASSLHSNSSLFGIVDSAPEAGEDQNGGAQTESERLPPNEVVIGEQDVPRASVGTREGLFFPPARSGSVTSSNGSGPLTGLNGDAQIENIRPPLEEVELGEIGVPRVNINGGERLLFLPAGPGLWSPMNLIIGAFGLAFAIMSVIYALKKKKSEQEDVENRLPFSEDGIGEIEEFAERGEQLRPAWLSVSIVTAIVGLFLFLLTQDMNRKPVLFDVWTAVHASLLAAEAIAIYMTFRQNSDDKKEH